MASTTFGNMGPQSDEMAWSRRKPGAQQTIVAERHRAQFMRGERPMNGASVGQARFGQRFRLVGWRLRARAAAGATVIAVRSTLWRLQHDGTFEHMLPHGSNAFKRGGRDA